MQELQNAMKRKMKKTAAFWPAALDVPV